MDIQSKMQEKLTDRRNNTVDILRGFSIISVVLFHLQIRVPFSGSYIGSLIPKMFYSFLFRSGYFGVCMFFVISGFLITTTALNRWIELPKINLKAFYTFRFARIIPLLVGLLIIISILHLCNVKDYVIDPDKVSLGRSLLGAITFHVNWLEMKVSYLPGSWDVLWTLSVEEAFYIAFPLLCIVFRKEKNLTLLVLVFLIISPLARALWFQEELGEKNNFAYLDILSIGCIAAVVAKRIEIKERELNFMKFFGWGLILFIVLFRFLAYQWKLTEMGLNITVLAIGTSLVLITSQQDFMKERQTPSKITAWFRFYGKNSYEIYLTHMFVVLGLAPLFKIWNFSATWIPVLYLIVLAASGILGNTIARYFSNPLNYKIRKHFKSKSHPVMTTQEETIILHSPIGTELSENISD